MTDLSSRPAAMLLLVLVLTGVIGCEDAPPPDSNLSQCEVSFQRVATLGRDAGVSGPSERSPVVRSQGIYFVPLTYDPGRVSVFDSNGRLVRSIGSYGEGPMEQLEATEVRVAGDTLYLFDYRQGRISQYHTNGEYIGTSALVSWSAPFTARMGGGLILARNAQMSNPDPFTVEVIRRDSISSRFTVRNESTETREKAGAIMRDFHGAGIWVGFMGRYLFEQYAYDGSRLARIHKDNSWFPSTTEYRANMAQYDTVTGVHDFAIDGHGRLLVLMGRVSKRAYEAELSDRQPDQGEAAAEEVGVGERVFQIIDPSTEDVVVEWVGRDPHFRGFADGEHLYTRENLENGIPILTIYRVVTRNPLTQEAC